MNAVTRKLLWAAMALAAVGLTACGGSKPAVDGGTGGGGGATTDCIEDTDCPDPTLFFCNTVTSKCEPSCRTAAQCTAEVRGEYALDFCSGPLGCQCDEGKCVGSLCSSDSDCGQQVCRSGACVAAPEASTVARCSITPDLVVMKAGAKAKFWVSAWDAANKPVVVKAGATWTALGAAVSGSGTGTSAEFTAGSAEVGTPTDAVQAAFGSITCKAKVVVLTAPSAGEVKVSVIDELSGRPIQGAQVVLSKGDGSIIQQGSQDSVATSAAGAATLTLTGNPNTYSVSVFSAEHSYVTVANYAGSSRLLSIALRRNQTDKYGGYKGGFSNVPATSNLHLGLAGMSLAGSITNLSLPQLLGPSVPTDVKIGTTVDEQDVPIPAGIFLGFGDQKIKDDVAGQGLNGTCDDEAKVLAGECGTRTAWALTGDVPLSELPIDAFTSGTDNLDFNALLSRLLPVLRRFNSAVARDVTYTLKPTPVTDAGVQDFSDTSHFTTANLDFSQVPLAFSFATKLPTLPQFRGAYADGAVIIGGTNVPGRGVVPLGLGVGVNTAPLDGQVDKQANLPAAGLMQVRMAPTHSGLEGSEYGLVISALSTKSLSDASAGAGASALYARLPGNKLAFDPAGATPVDLSGQAFPAFPDNAKFNFAATPQPGFMNGRSFRMTAMAGINVVRVSFTDGLDHRWDVLVDPAAPAFTLPVPPGVVRDRLFSNGVASGQRSTLLVQALKLSKDPSATSGAAISFTEFVELNDTNSERTTDFLTAFSFLDFGRPEVDFTTPAANNATIAAMSKVVVEVKNFKLGTSGDADGQVRLSFRSGMNPVSGCPGETRATETTAGNGVVEFTLPAGCTGSNLTMTAELVGQAGTAAIEPPVAKSVTVTIQ